MKKRVLITYATYAGSTIDVAMAIGQTLSDRGFSVDVIPVSEQPHVESYQAVLIGSAVQYANWLPEAVEFVKAHQAALSHMPVALFCVHIQNQGDDQTSRLNRLAYLDDVRPLLKPVDEAFFAGKFERRGASLLLPRYVAWMIPPIDFRKWKKIQAWANSLPPLLVHHEQKDFALS